MAKRWCRYTPKDGGYEIKKGAKPAPFLVANH